MADSKELAFQHVYSGETLVGFVMVYDESQRKVPPEKPNIGLWRLMIDHRFQRMGIGREVIRRIIEYAKSKNKFTELFTSIVRTLFREESPGSGQKLPLFVRCSY